MKEKRPAYGPCMMLAASLCFSLGGLLCKMIPWSALALNGFRNLLGCAVIGVYLLATKHRFRMNRVVAAGAVCMFGVTTLFVAANKLTSAANAIVLQYTAPIWILVMMAVFFGQKPRRLDLIAMAAVLCGVVCFFVDGLSSGGLGGDLAAVLAGVFYAGLFILNGFEDGDAISSLFFGQLAAGVLLTPLVARETDFSPGVLAAAVTLGVVQVGLAYIFFYLGTKHTHPVTAALINGAEPILNPLWVALFWGEPLSPLAVVGAAVVIISLIVYNIIKLRRASD